MFIFTVYGLFQLLLKFKFASVDVCFILTLVRHLLALKEYYFIGIMTMKANDAKVCSTSNCGFFKVDSYSPTGRCQMKHAIAFCNAAKTSPNYEDHKAKRQDKWFA